MEMTEKQASFQDFNDAARKVAENVPEDSALVRQIQDQMEDFNERWKALTSQVIQRISLVSRQLLHIYLSIVLNTKEK